VLVAASLFLFEVVARAVLGPPIVLKATGRARRPDRIQRALRRRADGLRSVCSSDTGAENRQATVSFIGDSFVSAATLDERIWLPARPKI
jgi:hypothetical protein